MGYADLLRRYIDDSGMTLDEIAAACKARGISIHPTYISKLRTGARPAPPNEKVSRLLAEVTGGDPELLIKEGLMQRAPDGLKQYLHDKAPISDRTEIKKISERGETREARNDIPPDILEELRALDVDTRSILFRSKKKLSPEGWRSVVDFIKWQLSQEEKKK